MLEAMNFTAISVEIGIASAPASTARGANEAAFPCPPVIGILPVIIEMRGLIWKRLPTEIAAAFCNAASKAASTVKIITSLPPFFSSAKLAAAPLAAKNKQ